MTLHRADVQCSMHGAIALRSRESLLWERTKEKHESESTTYNDIISAVSTNAARATATAAAVTIWQCLCICTTGTWLAPGINFIGVDIQTSLLWWKKQKRFDPMAMANCTKALSFSLSQN